MLELSEKKFIRPLAHIFRPLVMLFTQGCPFLIKYSVWRTQEVKFATLQDITMAKNDSLGDTLCRRGP